MANEIRWQLKFNWLQNKRPMKIQIKNMTWTLDIQYSGRNLLWCSASNMRLRIHIMSIFRPTMAVFSRIGLKHYLELALRKEMRFFCSTRMCLLHLHMCESSKTFIDSWIQPLTWDYYWFSLSYQKIGDDDVDMWENSIISCLRSLLFNSHAITSPGYLSVLSVGNKCLLPTYVYRSDWMANFSSQWKKTIKHIRHTAIPRYPHILYVPKLAAQQIHSTFFIQNDRCIP